MEFKVAAGAAEEEGREEMNVATDRLLDLEEVAAILGISRREVYRLISRGELPPPVKIGRCSKLPESEVAAYVENLKQARVVLSGGDPL